MGVHEYFMIQPNCPDRRSGNYQIPVNQGLDTRGPQANNPQEILKMGLVLMKNIQDRTQGKMTAYARNVSAFQTLPATQHQAALVSLQEQARQIIADISGLIDCLENIARLGTQGQQILLQNAAQLSAAAAFIDGSLLKNPSLQTPYNILESSNEGTASRREKLERALAWLQGLLSTEGKTSSGTRVDTEIGAARKQAGQVLRSPGNTNGSLIAVALPDLSIGSKAVPSIPAPVSPKNREDYEKDFLDGLKKAGYEIVRELGRGGMGVVYIANDGTGRKVALKRILNAGMEDIIRFKREAETVAKLTEKIKGLGLLGLYYFNQVDGNWIQVMELEKGPTEEGISMSSVATGLMGPSRSAEEDYVKLRNAVKGLHQYSTKKTDGIAREDLQQLTEFFVTNGQVLAESEQHAPLAYLSALFRGRQSLPVTISRGQIQKNEQLNEGVSALKTLVKNCPAFTKDEPKKRETREKKNMESRASLQDFIDLEDIQAEEAISGAKAKTIFKILREVSGEDFPETEMLEFWGHFMLGFSRTMQEIEANHVHHRDLKPANVLISSKGADVLCWMADQMLAASGEQNASARKKNLKKVVREAINKIRSTQVPLKIIDFGIVKAPNEREAEAIRSLSGEAGQATAKPTTGETNDLTINGQTLGTVSYMTPQSLTDMPDDPRRDLHAGVQTLWEIYGGEKFAVGPNVVTAQMGTILSMARKADEARKENADGKKSRTKKNHAPTALIELHPELVKTLGSAHPGLLDISHRATYLTEKHENCPEVTWQELTKYLEEWLIPKPLSKRTVAGGAVVLVAAMAALGGGIWKWNEGRKLRAEAERITASIDAEVGHISNLQDPKYNSSYFQNRRAEIRRVLEIYGQDIDRDLKQRLEKSEVEYEGLYSIVFFREKYIEWTGKDGFMSTSSEYLPLLREASSRASNAIEILQQNNSRYTISRNQVSQTRHNIDDRFIRPSCADPEIIRFATGITTEPDYNKKIIRMTEFVTRTLEQSQNQDLAANLGAIEGETLFRAAGWLSMQACQDTFRNQDLIRTMTPEARSELTKAVIASLRYFNKLKEILEKTPENENQRLKILTNQRLCAAFNTYTGLKELFGE